MTAHASLGPISQQYSAAATVPLIKSPSLWMPKPVEMPNDIHPLPDDITAYFVYPFTLEQHVLSIQPTPHDEIARRRARNAEILHQREMEEEQREKEALRRVAPGYNPASLLVPTSSTKSLPTSSSLPKSPPSTTREQLESLMDDELPAEARKGDAMDDLVAQLEKMESKR